MSASDTLLIELLTEELPPKSLNRLGESLRASMHKALADAGLIDAGNPGRAFATPRRLGVSFDAVAARQPDRTIERKGPAVASGLDDAGKPTRALEGFMRSAGVGFERLERIHDGKAEYFVARLARAGQGIDELVPGMLIQSLATLPVPKIMRWGDGEAQFVRPVHGLVMLHGARVIPGEVLGLRSGQVTRGHRFLGGGEIAIAHADEYERRLEADGAVLASFERRRGRIRELLDAAQPPGARWLPDDALLDEVTALVEHPTVYMAQFEPEFLEVPQECLILTMKQNQKYFPLVDEQGRLLNRFLIVSNMRVSDDSNIRRGNERVVRARLSDARFFFDQDRKTTLVSRVPRLAEVVYHNRLGSQLARVERLIRLAGAIAHRLQADAQRAESAARLAKADLLTDMVGEFPELQGIMGRYYARHDGEDEEIAGAIEMHYWPRFAGDQLPRGNIASAVALADRIDALVGFFGIGQAPTGDKDPFGLRRAALGVLRILMESPLPLDLMELVRQAAGAFPQGVLQADHAERLHDFLLERLRNLLREAGHAHETVEAVLALRPTRIDLVMPRLEAVKAFLALPEAQALAAANKRIVNILKKAAEKPAEPDVMLLQEDAERELFARMNELAPVVRSLVAAEDYTEALRRMASLREPVDRYFDKVMVMADEPLTRQNRLSMLGQLAALMNQVADISRLSVA